MYKKVVRTTLYWYTMRNEFGGCYKVNKEDVVLKMKTVSSRPSKYFQPVLTNNTRVVSAKSIENSLGKDDLVQVNVNLGQLDTKKVAEKLEKKISDKAKDKVKEEKKDEIKVESLPEVSDDVSDKILENIREQLKIETEMIENEEKSENKEKIGEGSIAEQGKNIESKNDNKDITTKMDIPINLKNDEESVPLRREPAEDIKELKSKLFLVASNAKKPVRIMVNRKMFLIGSDYSTMDCVIRNNRYISRCHAKIYYENDCYFLEDAGSMNGTYINGVKLAEGLKYKLISGDIINLADCKFEVNIM